MDDKHPTSYTPDDPRDKALIESWTNTMFSGGITFPTGATIGPLPPGKVWLAVSGSLVAIDKGSSPRYTK